MVTAFWNPFRLCVLSGTQGYRTWKALESVGIDRSPSGGRMCGLRVLVLLVIAAHSWCDEATRPESICVGGTCGDASAEPEPDGGFGEALGMPSGVDGETDEDFGSSEALNALLHLMELKTRLGLSTEEFLALAMPQRDNTISSDKVLGSRSVDVGCAYRGNGIYRV